MRELQRLASERWNEETRIQTALSTGLSTAQKAREKAVAEIERQFATGRSAANSEYERVCGDARSRYEAERNAAQQQYKGLRHGVESEHSRVLEAARSERQEASWEAITVFDALKGRPREKYLAAVRRLQRSNEELAVLEHDAIEIMKMRRQWREFSPVEPRSDNQSLPGNSKAHRVMLGRGSEGSRISATADAEAGDDSVELAMRRVSDLTSSVRQAATELQRQKLTRWFEGGTPLGMFSLIWAIFSVPAAIWLGWSNWQWIAVSLAIAVIGTIGLSAWLWPIARRQSGEKFQEISQQLADARRAIEAAVEAARERGRREAHALVSDRDQQLAAVDQKLHAIVDERERWKESEIGRAGQTFPQRLAQLRGELDEILNRAKQNLSQSLAQVTEERDRREVESRREYENRCRQLRLEHDRDWRAMADSWHSGLAEFRESASLMEDECRRLFPDWDTTDYTKWAAPTEPSPAIRFGDLALDLSQIKNGISPDELLRPAETSIELPALMTLEEHPVLLVTAEEEGRRAGIELLQLAMLRMLTAMPPGKVRFTILDPVGLGENFASFMHLADFDEQLIASRIWTDSLQIDEQLTRLTAHMETVLQKYLRNEFETIHEYNAQAGEVAEPFQVLVVANFPTNFGEAAARKLVSIATSGPRCGVYTLILVDRKQKMPANFDLDDLKVGAVHLDWMVGVSTQPKRCQEPFPSTSDSGGQNAEETVPDTFSFTRLKLAGQGHFRWRYAAFDGLPLTLDRPPSPERFNDVVRAAGRAAKDSMKVEVPFEQVAPPESEYWSSTSSKELVVPIGRAGARRLQSVRLGKGTSQHLLVCGKTGSGKSTFLHALITNTALHYSPDEVEFYLIDFKKGVEFKTYATHRLPHARVIAIESEREFGLSVLERLDAELRRRGDLFRAAGVQDLPDFRKARPTEHMPRVLLVVDEFQELFVEDDKLAQDSALLLDRLVRQGRAFGIHVLLGSQTLSGAYSLARSTMGQMAVRVALQCSEADAHLILSDERNEAARFLSRPGEAVYNDQNGLLAGNHPFQVVWLPEAKRIEYLRQIETRSQEFATANLRYGAGSKETIVFEGDQPADPAANLQLRDAMQRGAAGPAAGPQKAWLGAAVAIKEPTAATFARHAGSNLLVVGAWEESALGVMANAVVALAAQNRAGSMEQGAESQIALDTRSSPLLAPCFYILDGTRPESAEAGAWQRVVDALPNKIELAGPRETPHVIAQLAVELARREAAGEENAPPLYLIIFNGGRFRDLRRGEDDFSFSSDRDKSPSPDKQFGEILRSGPAWGIHTLLWCDSYNNVTRLVDRMTLREFEMRVAFQMSAADSSSLLDNPAAAKLRQHRGLLASEDLGTLEKFRPYGAPSDAWLEKVKQMLAQPRSAHG
jgi:hypothetical protein